MREIIFYNEGNHTHLGDCYYHLHYCKKLIQKQSDIIIYLYVPTIYHNELQIYLGDDSNRIIIKDTNSLPDKSNYIDFWVGKGQYYQRCNIEPFYFDQCYLDFFEQISFQMKIENPIKTLDDFLFDDPKISNHNLNFKTYNYLLINSFSLSGGYRGNIDVEFETVFEKLDKYGLTYITTRKVKDKPCTLDSNMSLLDIARQSLYVDGVFGIHTSPFIVTFNKWSINSIKNWNIIHIHKLLYKFNDRIVAHNKILEGLKII